MVQSPLSLTESTYAALKDDILSCRLAPGEFVTEADLAARYDVSKTPIREALNLLAQEGFIQSVPRRGTLIKPIELRDIQQTYLLRGLLEPPAASLAAERANPEELEAIRDVLTEMRAGDKDLGASHLRAHRRFHLLIGEGSGIPRLAKMINSLHEEVERFMNANPRIGAVLKFGDMDDHLLEAIEAKDPDRAREIARESVEVSRQSLIEAFLGVS